MYGEYMAGMSIDARWNRVVVGSLSMFPWWRVEGEVFKTAGSLGRAER